MAEVLHHRQRDGRDQRALAVSHELVVHDPSLPVAAAAGTALQMIGSEGDEAAHERAVTVTILHHNSEDIFVSRDCIKCRRRTPWRWGPVDQAWRREKGFDTHCMHHESNAEC